MIMNAHAEKNKHEKYYFVNELIFQIRHPDRNEDEASIREEVIRVVEFFLKPKDSAGQPDESSWKQKLAPPTTESHIITFLSLPHCPDFEPFSLISLKVDNNEQTNLDPLNPRNVLEILNAAYAELGKRLGIPSEGQEIGEPIELIPGSGFFLRAIAQSALSSGMHHGSGTPGPGSIPARRNPPTTAQHKFVLRGNNPFDIFSELQRPGARIAVLDTAQPIDLIPPDIKDKFLNDVEVILYPGEFTWTGNQYESKYDPYTAPHQHDDLEEHHHHYDVSPHGIFITSLIRMLTPTAKIYLYQVLNDFGVGTFMTIAQGLHDAIQQLADPEIPLVVNLSLMLDHEMPEEADLPLLSEDHTKETLMTPMKEVFDWATNCEDVLIVASAGNDGDTDPEDPGVQRADPRYPAAFEKVVSVTSLPKGHPRNVDKKEYLVSTYANRAFPENASEEKKARSFAVFGGGVFEETNAPLGGALGVYVGKIPRQRPDGTFVPPEQLNPNETGWAQWSGTSFAAPIVTALLAAQDGEVIVDESIMPPTLPKDPNRPLRTIDDENVIPVRQG